MANTRLLKRHIEDRGIMLNFLADKMNVCRQTFWSRMSGRSEFTAREIDILTKVLRLTKEERDEIFFSNSR